MPDPVVYECTDNAALNEVVAGYVIGVKRELGVIRLH